MTALVYSHNRQKDVEGVRKPIIYAIAFSSILLICYIFLMYYGIRDDNDRLKIAAFFTLGISVFIATVVGVQNFFQRPDKYTPYKDMVRKTLS